MKMVMTCCNELQEDENNDFPVERIVDFGTKSNFDMYECDMFDNLIEVINDALPEGTYISTDFPEPVCSVESGSRESTKYGPIIFVPNLPSADSEEDSSTEKNSSSEDDD